MQGFLYHVPALDAATLIGSATILGTAAVLACLLPARRAARIAPMSVLGEE
jgi:ABC-type antimicrobial peptide transport system permease subunit